MYYVCNIRYITTVEIIVNIFSIYNLYILSDKKNQYCIRENV